jgi:16S rRNA (guanine527-N7)-methyltransferase
MGDSMAETAARTLSDWLDDVGRRLDMPLQPQAKEQLLVYVHLLKEWNQYINLTAIVDDEGIAVRHILDSLILLRYLKPRQDDGTGSLDTAAACCPASLIDIGSGAGFPGLPLKIMRPGLDVVLLDSLGKRVKFLDQVIGALQLSGIRALHGRAEDAARDAELRERFDFATARAVAAMPALCEYGLPFLKIGGLFLAMKGPGNQEAQTCSRAVPLLGGELEDIVEYILPGTDMGRSLIRIRKIRSTPNAYPRKAGSPESKPLV